MSRDDSLMMSVLLVHEKNNRIRSKISDALSDIRNDTNFLVVQIAHFSFSNRDQFTKKLNSSLLIVDFLTRISIRNPLHDASSARGNSLYRLDYPRILDGADDANENEEEEDEEDDDPCNNECFDYYDDDDEEEEL
ncbi:MAG: hypothetical protein EZS28_019673 [Streblomastix strix]|uniref:Uncharacterized protein n=1 Tax=Streblomastix strix TaxID=222440 RepID=A0A5J4VQP3_9EUKA|nr:MAG: hypothetical protein EZS28_019673 [Streblomastix strix]